MFLLAYCSLLRISEIARMDRKDIFESTEELEGKPTQAPRIRVNPLAKNDKEISRGRGMRGWWRRNQHTYV